MAKRKQPITDEAIGALVRARRKELGMGQPELGEALGVTEQSVQKYETGKTALTLVKLARIAEVLKCQTLDLIP